MTAAATCTDEALDLLTVPDRPILCHARGCTADATWRARYSPCGHAHVFCAKCKAAADFYDRQYPDATPKHLHCGRAVTHTDWRPTVSTITLGRFGDGWTASIDGTPIPPIALVLWLQGIWDDKLTKPQRSMLQAIADGQTGRLHPKPLARLHDLALLRDGKVTALGEAVLWARP